MRRWLRKAETVIGKYEGGRCACYPLWHVHCERCRRPITNPHDYRAQAYGFSAHCPWCEVVFLYDLREDYERNRSTTKA